MDADAGLAGDRGAAEASPSSGPAVKPDAPTDGWYARYVLGVLLIVYIFNFIDRQILAILAEDIKADLGVTDAQLGFLFGTAFAVFYATFGIAFGRLADLWNRKKLIALGLGFWSLMTALSGLARSFLPLAACRFGVGVGEASATPAAYSILYDYFSPKVRTTVLAIYSGGVYIGSGLGLIVGGGVLTAWNAAWPDGNALFFGLKGWQAALMIVGAPGLVMSAWMMTLREPTRGAGDGVACEPHPAPFRETAKVIAAMIPGLNWAVFAREPGGGRINLINIAGAAAIALLSWLLMRWTGDRLQWIAMGVGAYSAFSWTQGLAIRDPVVFGLIFRCPALRNIIVAGSSTTFAGVALAFWTVPFLQRSHGASPAEAGGVVGGAAIIGFVGIVLGGAIADWLRARTPRGKLYVWLGGVTSWLLVASVVFIASDLRVVYAAVFVNGVLGPIAFGPGVSTINDLMIPRGRATTSAFAFMISTFLGIALGPYITGHLSDALAASGLEGGEALRRAILWSLALPLAGVGLVAAALPHIARDESSLHERARALGEPI